MTCIPYAKNGQKFQFDAVVNLDCLMAVPYVNGVFFTKLRPLTCRNTRQYSRRVSVVDNSVIFNSSHIFQCKARVNPEANVLEGCKLKISVRMESNDGKSFLKIGYVIVNLACFVASGFVRCRRRYLLKGYDEGRRGVGKRLDNSLLVVSFTCQQQVDNINFRLPPEDLSNCVSTSHSTNAHENAPAVRPTAPLPLMAEGWNEERVQMRARRRQKEHEVEEEGTEGSFEHRLEREAEKANATFNGRDFPPMHSHSPSFLKERIFSGEEEEEQFISPSSVSIGPEKTNGTSQPSFFPPTFDPSEPVQRIGHEEAKEYGSISSPSSPSSSPSHKTSSNASPLSASNVCPPAVGGAATTTKSRLTHDFSLSIHSRACGLTIRGGDRISGVDSVVGAQFHTCPHMRPSSLLSQHQRKMLGADSGFQFHALPPTSASSSTGVGGESAVMVSATANERCSPSSGFQSHSRNSSFGSAGVSRCVFGDLIPTPTSSSADYRLSVVGIGGSKQHLIDATRAPHDEVVNQILRTTIVAHRSASPSTASATAVGDTGARPLG